MPVQPQRELKVYVSEPFFDEIMNETRLCSCSFTSFARTAIAKELLFRRAARNKANRDLPLPGQRSIDGIV